jgi:hypothetical protein
VGNREVAAVGGSPEEWMNAAGWRFKQCQFSAMKSFVQQLLNERELELYSNQSLQMEVLQFVAI